MIKEIFKKYKEPVLAGLILASPASVPLALYSAGVNWALDAALSFSLVGINYVLLIGKDN